jgi:hypothetical protein
LERYRAYDDASLSHGRVLKHARDHSSLCGDREKMMMRNQGVYIVLTSGLLWELHLNDLILISVAATRLDGDSKD